VGLALVGAVVFAAAGMGEASGKPPIPPGKPLAGPAMWVWYVPQTGKTEQMVRDLKAHGIRTVIIKSGDGINRWKQFTPALVDRFHQAGIHVCAWHYIYGKKPDEEARISALAKQAGAECLIIDAEAEYNNHPRQAARYMSVLRKLVTTKYLLGLSSFPYVAYHEDFPYQEFLGGPNGAQVNLPQMYWNEIGVSPSQVVRDTYQANLRLGKPVYPVGQTWQDPQPEQISQFTKAVKQAGAPGWSWWDWGQTSPRGWRVIKR